ILDVQKDCVGGGALGLLDEALPIARNEHPGTRLLSGRTRHAVGPVKTARNEHPSPDSVNETFPAPTGGHLGGGAKDSRLISPVESMPRCTGAERLPNRFSSNCTAMRPSSVPLHRTAVTAGVASAARSLSAPATTDTSPGIESPRARIAFRTPASMAIPPAMMAVGRLGAD